MALMFLKKQKSLLWLAVPVIAALVLLFGYQSSHHKSTAKKSEVSSDQYHFNKVDCWFLVPPESLITCGQLLTPVSSGGFLLPVAIIHDQSAERRNDPLLYLQGGPGASASLDDAGILQWLAWRDNAGFKRDLVLMDTRGTGGSQPLLACAAFDDISLQVLRQNLSITGEYREGDAILRQCFQRAERQGFQLHFYGTAQSAGDVQGLIHSLPEYEGWNLFGVSYGTRLAMVAAHDFPEVRALILDSVYPVGKGNLEEWPLVLDQAIQRFARWCDDSDICTGDLPPSFIDNLQRVLSLLKSTPLELTVARWDGEWPVKFVLNDHRFLSFVFSALYDPYRWQDISLAMTLVMQSGQVTYAAAERKKLEHLMQPLVNNALSRDFFPMVFVAVDCMDQTRRDAQTYARYVEDFPLLSDYTRGLWQFQECPQEMPPVAERPDIGGLPRQPAILLSGDLDPITPFEWAQDIHQRWPTSQWLLLEATGHAVTSTHSCLFEKLADFLDNPHQIVSGCDARKQ